MRKNTEIEFSDDDYDRELEIAFEKGLLKPGLVNQVEDVKKFPPINNVNGLNEKLSKFKLNLPWVQTLDMVCEPAPLAPELAVQMNNKKKEAEAISIPQQKNLIFNDFAREMMFYRLAQAAVLSGIPRLHKLGYVTKRPDDYFAEMSKSDEHMHKIREKVKVKENSILLREKAKKLRELKKFGKKVQVEKTLQKHKEKKKMLDQLKKYRKGKLDSLDFLDAKTPNNSEPDFDAKEEKKLKKAQRKRKAKDEKFGVSGKKKGWKKNSKGDVDTNINYSRHVKYDNKKLDNSYTHKSTRKSFKGMKTKEAKKNRKNKRV